MSLKKPLPKNAVFGLIGGGALLVAVIGYMLLIKPQQSQLHEVQQQISETQKTISDYRQAAAQSNPTAVPKIKVADIYRLARAMPSDVDMPDVLIQLNDVATVSGVTLDSIQPGSETPGNGFQLEPIQLTAHGDFYALTDFVYRLRTLVAVRHGQLEAGGLLFAIESISLQGGNTPGASSAGSSSDLQATVKLDSFVYGADGSTGTATPAVPVTPSTPGSTDTTTTSSAPSASAEGAP